MTDPEYANQCIMRFIQDNLTLHAKIKKNLFYIDQWNEVALGARAVDQVVLHVDDQGTVPLLREKTWRPS